MILDELDNLPRYLGLSPAFDTAIEWLQHTDFSALTDGRINLSDDVYVNVKQVTMKPEQSARWERHAHWADIQIPLSQDELVGVTNAKNVPDWDSCDAETAHSFAPGMDTRAHLTLSRFIILFPGEAHKACVGEGTGRKIVVKVRCAAES